jgi:hypothetical protein
LTQYAPLKRWSTSMRLHTAVSQKSVIFTLTALRAWNLTHSSLFPYVPMVKRISITLTKFSFGRIMFLDFVHHLIFLRKQRFGNWIFPFSGKMMGAPTLLGPLERASPNHWSIDWGWLFLRDPTEKVPHHFTWGHKQIQFPKLVLFRNIRFGQRPKTWFFEVQYTIVRTL